MNFAASANSDFSSSVGSVNAANINKEFDLKGGLNGSVGVRVFGTGITGNASVGAGATTLDQNTSEQSYSAANKRSNSKGKNIVTEESYKIVDYAFQAKSGKEIATRLESGAQQLYDSAAGTPNPANLTTPNLQGRTAKPADWGNNPLGKTAENLVNKGEKEVKSLTKDYSKVNKKINKAANNANNTEGAISEELGQ